MRRKSKIKSKGKVTIPFNIFFIMYFIIVGLIIYKFDTNSNKIISIGMGILLVVSGIWGNIDRVAYLRPWKTNYELHNYLSIFIGIIFSLYGLDL